MFFSVVWNDDSMLLCLQSLSHWAFPLLTEEIEVTWSKHWILLSPGWHLQKRRTLWWLSLSQMYVWKISGSPHAQPVVSKYPSSMVITVSFWIFFLKFKKAIHRCLFGWQTMYLVLVWYHWEGTKYVNLKRKYSGSMWRNKITLLNMLLGALHTT